MHEELIIAGAGGQGVLVIGDLLAAAAAEVGKTIEYPDYGATMRGEKASVTVIISSEEIGSPISGHPDSLIAMNGPSLKKFAKIVKPNGLVLVNHSLAGWQDAGSEVRVIEIKATDIAQELGDIRLANMIMLGAYIKVKKIVSLESIINALRERFSEKWNESLIEINQKALERGFNEVNKPCV